MENIRISLEVEHSINQEVLLGQSENILPLLVTGHFTGFSFIYMYSWINCLCKNENTIVIYLVLRLFLHPSISFENNVTYEKLLEVGSL